MELLCTTISILRPFGSAQGKPAQDAQCLQCILRPFGSAQGKPAQDHYVLCHTKLPVASTSSVNAAAPVAPASPLMILRDKGRRKLFRITPANGRAPYWGAN